MSLPAAPSWLDARPAAGTLAAEDGPDEFDRLWGGFVTARVTLDPVLLLLQTTLHALGQAPDRLLMYVCGVYLLATLGTRFLGRPQRLGRTFDPQWVWTIGVDVAAFGALQFVQGQSGSNYTPLLALPVLLAQPGEIVYDLGAGDGRVLQVAANEFNARAVGIEVGPVQCVFIAMRALASGNGDSIRVRWENYFKASLKDADVVFIYATSKETGRLSNILKEEMKPGSRLVSISADFPEWEPANIDELELVFLYVMPPVIGSTATYLMKKAGDSG